MSNLKRRLNVGLIGGGISSVAGKVHIAAMRMDGLFEIVGGVFSSNSDISKKSAESYGLDSRKGYSSISDIFAHNEVDLMVVLTPTPLHADHIRSLAEYNIPIVCEKPMFSCLSELSEIDTYFKDDHPLFVTYNYTGYPMVRECRSMLKAGDLGKIIQVAAELPQDSFIDVEMQHGSPILPQPWRLKDSVIPNIALDLGSHVVQMIRFTTGVEFRCASGFFSNHTMFANIKDTLHMSGKLTNDASFNVWVTKAAYGVRNGLKIRVFCEHGSISWSQNNCEQLLLGTPKGQVLLDRKSSKREANLKRYNRMKIGHPAGFIEAFANHYIDIYEAICKGYRDGDFIFARGAVREELNLLEGISRNGHYERSCT